MPGKFSKYVACEGWERQVRPIVWEKGFIMWNPGGREYPAYNENKEDQLGCSHLA